MFNVTQKLDSDQLAAHPTARGVKALLIDMQYSEAAGEVAATLNTPEADVFDGSETPATVFVVSAEVADAGTIVMRGIDENDDYVEETVTLDGTTPVETTTLWKRLWPPYLPVAQTGNVTVHDAAIATETYFTITATATLANGSVIWVPDGWDAVIDSIEVTAITNAGSSVRGLVLAIAGSGFDDDETYTIGIPYFSQINVLKHLIKFRNGSDASITITQRYIVGAETFVMNIHVILKQR